MMEKDAVKCFAFLQLTGGIYRSVPLFPQNPLI